MPIEESLTLSRIEVERYIEPVIAQCLDLVQRALAGARLETNAIDRVIRVGGPTQIPVIRAALVSVLGNKMDYSIDPRSFSNVGDIKACGNLVALQSVGDAVSSNANCFTRKTCFQYRSPNHTDWPACHDCRRKHGSPLKLLDNALLHHT